MARVKGSLVVGVVKRAKRESGVRELLGREDRQFLESVRVLESGWYPLDVWERLVIGIEWALTGTQRGQIAVEFGRLTARDHLSGIYRAFFSKGDPRRQLERLPILWRAFFEDGRWILGAEGPGRHLCRYEGSAATTPVVCRLSHGLIEESLTMAGAARLAVRKTACRFVGEDHCAWDVWWSGAPAGS